MIKRFLLILALLLPLASIADELAAQDPVLAHLIDGDLIAICGDSITEQRGYSVMMATYLVACQPWTNLETMNFGEGGEDARAFAERVDPTVVSFHPTVATLCFGMNGSDVDLYRRSMQSVIGSLKKHGARHILIGTPGAVDTTTYRAADPVAKNQLLGEMSQVAKQLATENGIGFAEVHDVMLEAMAAAKAKYGQDYAVAGSDGVHPDRNGHLVMAYCFLKALGCKGDIGTVTVDMQARKATATAGHKVVSFADGKLGIESSRYPYCFSGDPASPNSTTGMIEFIPFNQELNRYLLVVKNSPAASMKITWGKTSKTFSAEKLAKGVNLAAELLDNPFLAPFAKVEEAISNQQIVDVALSGPDSPIKHAVLRRQRNPQAGDKGFAELIDASAQVDALVRAHVRTQIAPVNHSIVIEAAGP